MTCCCGSGTEAKIGRDRDASRRRKPSERLSNCKREAGGGNHDLSSAEAQTEFPQAWAFSQTVGIRTALITPLIREGVAIGAIQIRRQEIRPFSEKQISLLKTFAAQSVIAIENVRLFKEIEERNAELREALEHQTATSEVLSIISRSPTDVQPVLDAIVESAARVCGIDDVVLRLRQGNTMSHELRTPLNAIIGFSEVLQEKLFGELNEKQAEYTDDILTSGRHLLSLINEILDLSKVEAGRMTSLLRSVRPNFPKARAS